MRPKCGPFDVFHSARARPVTSLHVEWVRSTFTCLRTLAIPIHRQKGYDNKRIKLNSFTWNWNVLFGRGNFEQSLNECQDGGKGSELIPIRLMLSPTVWYVLCVLGTLALSSPSLASVLSPPFLAPSFFSLLLCLQRD